MLSGQSVCLPPYCQTFRTCGRHEPVISLFCRVQGENSDHPSTCNFLPACLWLKFRVSRRKGAACFLKWLKNLLLECIEPEWCLMLVDIKFHHLSVENGDNVRWWQLWDFIVCIRQCKWSLMCSLNFSACVICRLRIPYISLITSSPKKENNVSLWRKNIGYLD